ncbi:unknown [Roseburia sp. CAG:100]|nr:unknown [Roseburia sp. CAG:100]
MPRLDFRWQLRFSNKKMCDRIEKKTSRIEEYHEYEVSAGGCREPAG